MWTISNNGACMMESTNQQFIAVKDLPTFEPALTVSGFRDLYFYHRERLELEGVVCRFGRKILINLPNLRAFIVNGGAKSVKGAV